MELVSGWLVAYDDAVGVELEGTDGPHLGYRAFYGGLQGLAFVVAVAENHHFASVHHCSNAYCKRLTRHLIDIIIKES